jgi:hypothetical protein
MRSREHLTPALVRRALPAPTVHRQADVPRGEPETVGVLHA